MFAEIRGTRGEDGRQRRRPARPADQFGGRITKTKRKSSETSSSYCPLAAASFRKVISTVSVKTSV